MQSPHKIEYRDPADLAGHFHPALKTIPELAETCEEFKAIAAGVGKCGIIQPLIVDEDGRILDDHSRTMLRCARRWQLKQVPVQVRESSEVHLLIVHSLAHRRHLTKSAIAYLAVPHLDQAFEIARAVKLKQIASNSVVSSETTAKTVDDLADELGLGRNLLFEARKVHAAFADKKKYPFTIEGGPTDGDEVEVTLREWFEPRLLRTPIGGEHEQNRPMGLGGVIAGIASVKETNRDKFNPKGKGQLQLFTRAFGDLVKRWVYWGNFKQGERDQHFEEVRETIATLAPERCEELAEYHSKLAAEFRKAAKKEAK